jgi:murein DD-endopeptidase MepM/ murein hydrolase activator NlpD
MLGGALVMMLLALTFYHWIFLQGAREGWPVVGTLVRLITKDEFDQRDRYLRQNIDLLARRLGEVQAKLIQLESLGQRVSGLAGIPQQGSASGAGAGGPEVLGRSMTMDEISSSLEQVGFQAERGQQWLSTLETQLFDKKMHALMLPTQRPVPTSELGSLFGWRVDPITGHAALHTGLDFPAPAGTPILAAAGGMVVTREFHPEYGLMIEVDHGNDLLTRYAHASSVSVKVGDLVKRGQVVGAVGTTGRTTGAHLHFEVLLHGVWQDPQKFLAQVPNATALVRR